MESKSDRLHSSIESFIKIQMRNGQNLSTDEIFDTMKKERPLLYRYFKPSLDQLMFFIVSNNRDLVGTTPDLKRITRSSNKTTPCEKFPQWEPKKREMK